MAKLKTKKGRNIQPNAIQMLGFVVYSKGMRKLAIDYGKKRIGLAVSDSGGRIAICLDTLLARGMREDVDSIKQIAFDRDVDTLVLGLPLNMDGTEGKRACLSRKFGGVLHKATGLKVEFFDERLTSVEAEEIVGATRKHGADKGEVDKVAAMLILQAYLDAKNRR